MMMKFPSWKEVSRKIVTARCVTAFGLALAATIAVPAYAALTQTDVLVAERVIGFVEKFGSGVVRVGIVVVPDSALSIQEGNDLKALLGNQLRAGDNVLQPILVRTDQLADADVGLLFLTDGMGAGAARVASISKARKITCITFDLTQVKNGSCTIGIQSRPKIEVFRQPQSGRGKRHGLFQRLSADDHGILSRRNRPPIIDTIRTGV